MNAKSILLVTFFSIVVVGIVSAMLVLAFIPNIYKPSQEVLTIQNITQTDTPASLTGGSVNQGEVQTVEGSYYKELTAVADEGYTFAYWENNGSKLAGDITITLRANSVEVLNSLSNACTPVFISNQNVFNISNLDEFNSVLVAHINSGTTSGKIYKLTGDINSYSNGSSAITLSLNTFSGVLDGNNFALRDVFINGAGLFDSIDGGVVKNLVLANGSLNSNLDTYIGSFAGSINNGLISKCVSNLYVNNLKADGYAGGIVGVCSSTTVKSMLYSCAFYGALSADNSDQMIANNLRINTAGVYACSVFRPKYNGATA